ncbi:MAG: hypothetical protein ACW97Z_16245 [Candidatus Hodarchaeales archaeon]|jgi:hypothetical protein
MINVNSSTGLIITLKEMAFAAWLITTWRIRLRGYSKHQLNSYLSLKMRSNWFIWTIAVNPAFDEVHEETLYHGIYP